MDAHLQSMESCNIKKAILSISSPGTHLKVGNNASGLKLARHVNTFASALKRERPDKFGFWASLPLPDVEGSLSEIARVFDELDADGVALLTNYHGIYIGDKAFDRVFDELNRRNATIFIHPTSPRHAQHGPLSPTPQFPAPMMEFLFDTTRAALNLLFSGTISRCPSIKIILSHCGGALPPLSRRAATMGPVMDLPGPRVDIDWAQDRLNSQFYFDTAGLSLPEHLQGLLQHVSWGRLLYGTDYPFTPGPFVEVLSRAHDEYLPNIFTTEQQHQVYSGNARNLLKK